MKVLALTRYSVNGASSRMRVYKYAGYLAQHGIEVEFAPLFDEHYLELLYTQGRRRVIDVIKAYYRRALLLVRRQEFDLIWVEKELFPWLPGWADTCLLPRGVPVVVDFDDAVFHNYDLSQHRLIRALLGGKFRPLLQRAAAVMVGADYLGLWAATQGARRIERVPTGVDAAHYVPVYASQAVAPVRIGWIGSPATSGYLDAVRQPLRELCRDGRAMLVTIGAPPLGWDDVPVECLPWSDATEAAQLASIDIGIMPLPDGPWEQGKCGYKLIQYMAAGKPVVASAVGENRRIVQDGVNGYLANGDTDWIQALQALIGSPALRRQLGEQGRLRVGQDYDFAVIAPRLEHILRQAAGAAGQVDPPGGPVASSGAR